MSKEMTYQEAEDFVVSLLKSRGPMATADVEAAATASEKHCPDKTILVLTKLKARGLIKGKFMPERRTWQWWVE